MTPPEATVAVAPAGPTVAVAAAARPPTTPDGG